MLKVICISSNSIDIFQFLQVEVPPHPITNVEFKGPEVDQTKPKKPETEAEAEIIKKTEDKKPTAATVATAVTASGKVESKGLAEGKKQPIRIGSKEEDLIQVVLTAVEDNWLKQAPHPTLDKSKALQVERDESADLSESERDTSEADYLKVKEKAAQLISDDEGTNLVRQESNGDRDLPYLETTLPQEKPGIGKFIIHIFTRYNSFSYLKLISMNKVCTIIYANHFVKCNEFTKIQHLTEYPKM